MTAALQVVPSPRAAPAPSNPHPDSGLLTVTVNPVHPGAEVITVCGEVDPFVGPLLLDTLLAQLRRPDRRLMVDLILRRGRHIQFEIYTGLTQALRRTASGQSG